MNDALKEIRDKNPRSPRNFDDINNGRNLAKNREIAKVFFRNICKFGDIGPALSPPLY
jgi:hypothetical protein